MLTNKIIRLPELIQSVGLSASSIWRKEQAGTFPKRRQLGVRCVGWLASEVEEWIKNRQLKTEKTPNANK